MLVRTTRKGGPKVTRKGFIVGGSDEQKCGDFADADGEAETAPAGRNSNGWGHEDGVGSL